MAGVKEGLELVMVASSYVMAQALYAAAKLGVADHLAAGAQHIDALAAATDSHAPSLYRLMRALSAARVFVEDDQRRFALTPHGETLRSDVPGSIRAAIVWIGEPMHYRSCGELLASVKSGLPAFERLFGLPYFDYFKANPEAGRVFGAGMACFSEMEEEPIAKAYEFPAGARVVDVGGGRGGFLAQVLMANPSLRGLLYDMPDIVKEPVPLQAAGLLERCEIRAGSFFEAVPPGGDIYVLKRVLHDWDDDVCLALLRRCRAVMGAESRLLVVDAVIPPGNDFHPGKLVDLMMLTVTGRERTEAEFQELFRAAGLKLTRVIPTPRPLSFVEGVPV